MISWSTIHESATSFSRSHVVSEGSGSSSLLSAIDASGGADILIASSYPDIVTEEAALHAYEAGYEDAIRKSVVDATRLEALEIFRSIMARMDSSPFKSAEIYFLCMCNAARTLEALGRNQEAYGEILRAVELRPDDFHAVFKAATLALEVGDTWSCRRFLESDVVHRHALKSIVTLMLSKCDKIEESKPVIIRRSALPSAEMLLWVRKSNDDDWSFLSQLHDPELWTRPFVAIRDINDSTSSGCISADDSRMDTSTDHVAQGDSPTRGGIGSATRAEASRQPGPCEVPAGTFDEATPVAPKAGYGPMAADVIESVDSSSAYASCDGDATSSSATACVVPRDDERNHQQEGEAEVQMQKEEESGVSGAPPDSCSAPSGTNGGVTSTASASAAGPASSRRSARRAQGPSQEDGTEARCEIADTVRATLARLYPAIADRIMHPDTAALSKPRILHDQFMYDRASEILTRATQPEATVVAAHENAPAASSHMECDDSYGAERSAEEVLLKLNDCMSGFRKEILGFSGNVIPTSRLASMFISFASEVASCLLTTAWVGSITNAADRTAGVDLLMEAMRKNAILMAFVARVSYRRSERGGSGLDALEEEMRSLGEAEALLVLECCGDWLRSRCDGGRRSGGSGDAPIGLLDAASFYDFARKTCVFAINKFAIMKADKANNPQGVVEDSELTRVRKDWARFIFDMNALSHREQQTSRQSMSSVAASEFLVSTLQRTNKQINFPYLRSIANVLCEASIGLAGNSQPVKEMLKEYGLLYSSEGVINAPDALGWASQAVSVLEESFDTAAFVSALRAAIANDFECMNQSILGNDTALVVLYLRIVEVISGVDREDPGRTESHEVRSRLVRLAAEAVKSHCKLSGPEQGGNALPNSASTDQSLAAHMEWIDVLLGRISSGIRYSMKAVSESAVRAQVSWRKRPYSARSEASGPSNLSPFMQAAVALTHIMFCIRGQTASVAGNEYRQEESIFGSCLQLIAAGVSLEVARIGGISEDEYDAFYRYFAEHLLSACFSVSARLLGSAESMGIFGPTEAASLVATTILLHRAPDASIAFLPQFTVNDAGNLDNSKLDGLNQTDRENVLNSLSQALWVSELIVQSEKSSLPVCSSNYICLAEAILVIRHQPSRMEVIAKEGLDAALVSAFEAARSKIPDSPQYYGIIEVIDMYAINSLMPIFYSIRAKIGCGGVLRYGDGARRLLTSAPATSSGARERAEQQEEDEEKREEEETEDPYDPEATEKLVLFIGQILCDRFDLPIFDTSSSSVPSADAGSRIIRSIPNELAFDIYSFLTYAKTELALVSRTSWKTCLTALYNMDAFRSPPPSDLTSELRSYLFEQYDETAGDMLSRARGVVDCVEEKQRVVRDRIEAAAQVFEGDELIEIKSTFYYECLVAGVATSADSGNIEPAEDAPIPFLDDWNSSDVINADNATNQGVNNQSVAINLREHCEILLATQRRVCPNMLLAWYDLSYNNDIRDSTDTLERLLIGFYELASASMEELSKLCFPPGLLASLYAAAPRLSWPDPTDAMTGILNVLKAIRILAHRIPSLESRSGDSGSSDTSTEVHVCCDRSSDTLTCRAVEAMFNKYGSSSTGSMDVDGLQGPDYSMFELLALFLCRYHKTAATLFHRAADLLIATKFASPSAMFSEVPAVCDAMYLEEFVKRASSGAVPAEASENNNGPDSVASIVAAERKALVSVAELRVLLEYSLSVLFHREDQISEKEACFQRTLRHCVQGFIFSIQLDTLSYFLPTFAADLAFRLGLGLQSVHYFLHQADATFKALSVDKKLRIHILHVYHNARLQTSLKWLFSCYDFVNGTQSRSSLSPAFDLLALTDDLSILDTFKVSSLEAPPGSIASATAAAASAPAHPAGGAPHSSVSGFGIAAITAGSVGTMIPSPIVLTSEITSSMQIGSPVSSFSPGGSGGVRRSVSPSLVRAISHLWSTVLEALAGLRLCRKLDVWDAKSIYTMSKAIVDICDHETLVVPDCVRASLQLAEITLSVPCAADLMWRLFEKRRPQVVALWKTEKGTGSRFDQIFQQEFKYDLARKKYFMFMLNLLLRDAPTQLGPRRRLVEMASASLATKERSAVSVAMARSAVEAVVRVTAWDPIDTSASITTPAVSMPVAMSVDPTVAGNPPTAISASAPAPDTPSASHALPAVFGVPYSEFNQLTQLAVTKRASHDAVCIHKVRALALFMARCLSRDIERVNVTNAMSGASNPEVASGGDPHLLSNTSATDITTRAVSSLSDPDSLEYPDLLRHVAELLNRVFPATSSSSSAGLKRSRQSTGKRQAKSNAAPANETTAVSKSDTPLPMSIEEQSASQSRLDGATPEVLPRADVGTEGLTAGAGSMDIETAEAPDDVNDHADMLMEPPNKRAHIV